MATKTATQIKAFFNAGDVPTESNFTDLSDSYLNLTDGGTVGAKSLFSNGLHAKYTAAAGYGPADLIVGKNSSISALVDPFTSGAGQLFPLGAKLIYGNTTFRYGKLGASAVTAGKCVTHAVLVGNHADIAPTADVAAGQTAISIETGGDTDITLNQYAGGYLLVNDGTAEGQLLRINSNPVHDHSADASCVITTYDDLATALESDDSKIDLIADPNSALIVQAATTTGATFGVTVVDTAANHYAWFAIAGPAAVLTSGTIVIGNQAVPGGASGAVIPGPTNTVIAPIGTVMFANGAADYSLINLWGI